MNYFCNDLGVTPAQEKQLPVTYKSMEKTVGLDLCKHFPDAFSCLVTHLSHTE